MLTALTSFPQIGADLSEFVVILNSEDAVRSFCLAGNLTIGGNLSAAAGPIGTGGAVQAAIAHPAPMFSYSRNKGFYAGMSLEGTVLVERKDANKEFYGQPIPAKDLLEGKVPAPEAASAMYEVIEAAEMVDESHLPEKSFVPSATPGGQGESASAYNLSGGGAASGESAAAAGGHTGSQPIFDA
jgi:lipid-binding SYLF domain-containing protein